MTKLQKLAVSLMAFAAISMEGASLHAQAASGPSQPTIAVIGCALDKDRVPVGQSPWAILTLKNLTDHEVAIHDSMIRLHVEDEKGERPMTRVQRNITHKLLHREAPLPGVGGIWFIPLGETSSHRYELSFFYDLSMPGKHKAYMDVMDPTSQKWLRTNTVQFEMVAVPQ